MKRSGRHCEAVVWPKQSLASENGDCFVANDAPRNDTFFVLFFVFLMTLSGCISIGTYEQQMKKCRDTNLQIEQLKAQVSALEAKNLALEKSLDEKMGQ